MDIKKLAQILLFGGFGLIVLAIYWWASFYGDITGNLGDALGCLYSTNGACAFAAGFAQMVGKTPYSPTLFWVGIAGFAVGGILKYSLNTPSDKK